MRMSGAMVNQISRLVSQIGQAGNSLMYYTQAYRTWVLSLSPNAHRKHKGL